MLKRTHQRIANRLYDDFPASYQALIDRKEFVKSSIIPDHFLYHPMILHRYEYSVSHIDKLILEMTSLELNPKQLAHKLGIVIHFLCDYAVAYHSNPRYKNHFLHHHLYEEMIDQYALPPINYANEFSYLSSLSTYEEDLQEYVSKFHQKNECNPQLDYIHGLLLSKNLATQILSLYYYHEALESMEQAMSYHFIENLSSIIK